MSPKWPKMIPKNLSLQNTTPPGRQGCCLGCHTRENKEYVRTCAGLVTDSLATSGAWTVQIRRTAIVSGNGSTNDGDWLNLRSLSTWFLIHFHKSIIITFSNRLQRYGKFLTYANFCRTFCRIYIILPNDPLRRTSFLHGGYRAYRRSSS